MLPLCPPGVPGPDQVHVNWVSLESASAAMASSVNGSPAGITGEYGFNPIVTTGAALVTVTSTLSLSSAPERDFPLIV